MSDLPVKKSDDFLAEVEVMDLTKLKNGQFIVAIGTGAPDSFKMLGSSVHGPYSFVEMIQEVGDMWATHQHHAKVIMLSKDTSQMADMLDENTIDYIECHYGDLITEEMLAGAFDIKKDFTCQAGLLTDDGEDPRRKKQEETLDGEVSADDEP